MNEAIHIENISELNKLMGQEEPKHPLIGIIDFSKLDFTAYGNIKISTGFYTVMLKNLCPGALRSSVPVSEIAYDLGFEYPRYFSKVFKKNTGMTTAEYRTLN